LNCIDEIIDETGQRWESPDSMEEAFIKYFTSLFTAGAEGDMEPCLQHLKSRISLGMNAELLMEFTKEEINAALFQMGPLKAPSLDSFTA
jgi:hypothetical protein